MDDHVAELLQPAIDPVEDWRLHKLIERGYSVDDAVAIAGRHDVDLHQALELIGRGCAPEIAVRILL